jgi:ATP-dependent DNA helicase RecQ
MAQLSTAQVSAMTALMEGGDVLAVLPTGTGESAIYQVPTVLLSGLTVIVSLLLALQRDQVECIAESQAPAGRVSGLVPARTPAAARVGRR